MNFEKEIDKYFSSLGEDDFVHIKNPFTANVQMLQAGTGNMMILQCNSYKNCYPCYSSIVVASFVTATVCKLSFLVLVEIKLKLSKIPKHDLRCTLLMFHLIFMTMSLLPKSRLIYVQ